MVNELKRWSKDFIFVMVLLVVNLACMIVPLPFFMNNFPRIPWWDIISFPSIFLAFPCTVLMVHSCYRDDRNVEPARDEASEERTERDEEERTVRDSFLVERRKRQLRPYALLVGITITIGLIGVALTRCENDTICVHFVWPIATCVSSATIVVLMSSKREIVDRWEKKNNDLESAWHTKRKADILEMVSRWKKASRMPISGEVAFKRSK